MVRSVSCCCKRTSITVQGDPVLNLICNCDDCKRRSGSAFGWSACFADSQVLETSGEAKTYDVQVSPPQQRYFCATCGSTLYWKSESFPGLTGVAGGGFIDSPLPEPTASYRDGKRCAWVGLPTSWDFHS